MTFSREQALAQFNHQYTGHCTMCEDVIAELVALKGLGYTIPEKAFALAREIKPFEYNGMSVGECADLMRELASI